MDLATSNHAPKVNLVREQQDSVIWRMENRLTDLLREIEQFIDAAHVRIALEHAVADRALLSWQLRVDYLALCQCHSDVWDTARREGIYYATLHRELPMELCLLNLNDAVGRRLDDFAHQYLSQLPVFDHEIRAWSLVEKER